MKDRRTESWWLMHHWTDQKIFAQGLYCSLTILIRSLIMRKVKKVGLLISMRSLHNKLKNISKVLNVFPEKRKGKSQSQTTVIKMDDIQNKCFTLFSMNRYLAS